MEPVELFQAGKLSEAIESAIAKVKADPTNIDDRSFLCEMLCFQQDFDRADKQLDSMSAMADPELGTGISEFRHLIRAAVARRDAFDRGELPELVVPSTPEIEKRLKALVALRQDDRAAAAELIAEANNREQTISAKVDGKAVDDFRDFDDLLWNVCEVMTANGKYMWVPLDKVKSICFEPLQYARDQIWRRAEIDVEDGPEGRVFIPVIYQTCGQDVEEPVQLGRVTQFVELPDEVYLCQGRREYLIDGEERSILEISEIEIETTGQKSTQEDA